MRLLPVLDLLQGHIVRGVAGQRQEYRPIVSRLTNDTRPLSVARALRAMLNVNRFYLADLDAIQGASPAWHVYEQLINERLHLWIDAGLAPWPTLQAGMPNVSRVLAAVDWIAGLESLESPAQLAKWLAVVGPDRLVFSLDLQAGAPRTTAPDWPREPHKLLQLVHRLGVRRLIVLDLAGVGMDGGVSTLELCRAARRLDADWQLISGGGVRGLDDLAHLAAAGVDLALVASALHDGRLTREPLALAGLLDDETR